MTLRLVHVNVPLRMEWRRVHGRRSDRRRATFTFCFSANPRPNGRICMHACTPPAARESCSLASMGGTHAYDADIRHAPGAEGRTSACPRRPSPSRGGRRTRLPGRRAHPDCTHSAAAHRAHAAVRGSDRRSHGDPCRRREGASERSARSLPAGMGQGVGSKPKKSQGSSQSTTPPLRLNALSMLECLPDRPASVSSAATAAASVRFADVEPRDISPSGQIRRGTASVPGRRAVPPASGRPGDSSRARACVRRVRAESSDGHARAAGGSSEQGRAKCQVPAAARHDSSSKGPDAHGMIGTSLCTLAVYSLSNSKKGTHHTSCASCMSSVDGIPCHGARFVKLPVQLIWHCIGTRTPRKASPIHHPCMHG